jgi:aminopeptidase N
MIRSYLATHAFQNVISRDLYSIILQVTGRDLGWFFEDWIYGAGHPIFEVAYDYLPDIGKLHLKVKQVQPSVEGQDLFRLPVTVTIETSTHRFSEQIEVSEAEQDFLLSCPDYPLMVSFDGAGDLVAEIREEKGFQEWIYQAQYDSTAGRIRALRHLAENHPNNEQTLGLLDQILREETSSWHLRAEAALLSGKTCSSGESTIIQMASKDSDYRVRKALAIGLRRVPNRSVSERLQQLLESETHPDVKATLLVSLSLIDPDACRRLIPDFIGQTSWYDEFTIAALKAMQNFAGSEMLNMIKPFTGEKYNYQVRRSAFDAWIQAYPEDPELAERLIDQVSHGGYALRNFSIDALGEIRSTAAEGVLVDVIEKSGDADLRAAAVSSLEKIQLGRAKNRSEIYEKEHDVRKRK